MNLKKQIEALKMKSAENIPEAIKEQMNEAAHNLKVKHLENKALKEQDIIPEIILENAIGEIINVNALLDKGPLIISFFRGAWCPYCNLELQAYEEIVPEIKEAGGQFVAISPEVPDGSLSLKEKHALTFEILSDIDNSVAKAFGLVFKLEEKLIPIYEKIGIDLVTSQKNENYELPMPATYVVNQQGEIVLAHIDSDYTNRLEPKTALEVLEKL